MQLNTTAKNKLSATTALALLVQKTKNKNGDNNLLDRQIKTFKCSLLTRNGYRIMNVEKQHVKKYETESK